MKTFLYLLSLAGLLIVTGCAVDEGAYGGYYGPSEFSVGVGVNSRPYYYQPYYYNRYYRYGYWDRGRYYYRY